MDPILKLAGDAGLTKDQGEAATGGIMSLVKSSLASGDYKKILDQIPEIGGLVTKHEEGSRAAGGDSGGLMGSAMSMFGGGGASGGGAAAGAGGVAGLLAMLEKQGIDASQVSAFMPQVASVVKSKCGVDIGSVLGVSSDGGGNEGGDQPSADDLKASAGNAMGGLFGK
jgi:hypothetical protein